MGFNNEGLFPCSRCSLQCPQRGGTNFSGAVAELIIRRDRRTILRTTFRKDRTTFRRDRTTSRRDRTTLRKDHITLRIRDQLKAKAFFIRM
jgi:hypothetical protein